MNKINQIGGNNSKTQNLATKNNASSDIIIQEIVYEINKSRMQNIQIPMYKNGAIGKISIVIAENINKVNPTIKQQTGTETGEVIAKTKTHKILKIKIERIKNIITASINKKYITNIVIKKVGKAGINKHPLTIEITNNGQQHIEVIHTALKILKLIIIASDPTAPQTAK